MVKISCPNLPLSSSPTLSYELSVQQTFTEIAPLPTIPKKPEYELSVGEVLSQSFRLYKAGFARFSFPFVVAGLVNRLFSTVLGNYIGFPRRPTLDTLLGFLVNLLVALAVYGIASWIVNTIANGIVVKYSSDLLEKGNAKLRESLDLTLSRLVPLLGAGIGTGILIIVGLIALLVPGIILMIMFSLTVPVIMIERLGALDSLGRSRKLVRNRWGKTFVVLLLIGVVFLFVGWIIETVSSPFGFVSPIVTTVLTALIQSFQPIATTFLYYSMRAKEIQLETPSTPAQPQPTLPAKKYCMNCGAEIPAESAYCPKCRQRQDR